jgi:acetoacetyl-CoA synthetase
VTAVGADTLLLLPAPERAAASQLADFMAHCGRATGERLDDWAAFHEFSVTDYRRFWRLFADWAGVLSQGSRERVCTSDDVERALFFPDVELSYAENLLAARSPGDDERIAVIACDERGRIERVTRGALRRRVRRLAAGYQALGVGAGDRVVGIVRNSVDAIAASLAAAAVGATWSSCAPDLGADAILSRFEQIGPSLLVADTSYDYHGVTRDVGDRVRAVAAALPTLRTVVTTGDVDALADLPCPVHAIADVERDADESAPWPRFGFNHPLFILFSSGTTGVPKCIVHGAGGTLLEHLKEQRLHSDFGTDDVLCFHTSSGWMMWNWQLSALACGTAIVLWDGSVTFPAQDALLQLLARERVTVFGTSPAYLQLLRDAGIVPREVADLSRLRAVQSTGSILFDDLYDWAHQAIGPVPLQSISGGTDIIGCFVLGNPLRPLWRGESQSVSLAMEVRAFADGEARRVGVGELVCVAPFPSRPLGLLDDAGGRRFHDAYFAEHPGIWTHGDHIELTDRGTARMLGRSDGTLNVRGVRIGPAEIYRVVQAVPGVREAMAIEQAAPREPGGSRLVLLVVLAPGLELDRALTLRIKKELSQKASPNHVPSVIAQMDALPTTHSGKRSERAARDAINGREVVNAAALRNPEVLDILRAHPALQLARAT